MMKEKFKVHNGYKFEKKIFRITLVLMILFLVAVVLIGGTDNKFYFICDSPTGCDISSLQEYCFEDGVYGKLKYSGRAEFMQSCGLCNNQSVVMNGFSCGEKPSSFQSSATMIFLLILVVAFLVNHFKNNKDYKFKEDF